MKSMQFTGYALIASAILLAAATTFVGYRHFESTAHAQNIPDMMVTKGGFTVLSTEGCGGRSNVFVLDNRTERLMAYDHGREIEVIGRLDVARQVELALRR